MKYKNILDTYPEKLQWPPVKSGQREEEGHEPLCYASNNSKEEKTLRNKFVVSIITDNKLNSLFYPIQSNQADNTRLYRLCLFVSSENSAP